MDGGAMDPAIARILLVYRERVAQATEDALVALRRLGADPGEILSRLRPSEPPD